MCKETPETPGTPEMDESDYDEEAEERQELHDEDLLEQIEGWAEYPEEPSDDELEEGICLLEERINKSEKYIETEEPLKTWQTRDLVSWKLWLKNLQNEEEFRKRIKERMRTPEHILKIKERIKEAWYTQNPKEKRIPEEYLNWVMDGCLFMP